MKSSMNSTSRSPAVSIPDEADDGESPEESSWTMYFEDFSKNNNEVMGEENSSFCSDINYQTSSLVSDAACSAATRHVFGAGNNRLSFKKRKKTDNKGKSLVEDDLEDTACSPVNSPKVCNLVNHFGKNLIMQKDGMNISQEKGNGSEQIDERNDGDELGLDIGRENEGTNELKNKGLCLFPLSMVAQYLG